MKEDKKQVLIENTTADIVSVTDNIKYRHTTHCYLSDAEYGEHFAKAAGFCMEKVEDLTKLDNNGLI